MGPAVRKASARSSPRGSSCYDLDRQGVFQGAGRSAGESVQDADMGLIAGIWIVVRFLLALAGLLLVLTAVTSLLGWFTIAVEGEPIAWYWLLAAGFVLGLIGMIGDKLIEGT